MSEKQDVVTRRVGFGFSITVEKELREETGAKYPDKTVVKASIEGNADTFESNIELLGRARTEIFKVVAGNSPTLKEEK